MTFFESSVLAVVEGLTEYLPVSSTGHIILTSALMGIHEDDFTKYFTVMVQFGAIFAVVLEYFRVLTTQWRLYPVLFVAFLPAAVFGLGLHKLIDQALGSVWVVGASLLLGGILLLFTDKIFKPKQARIHNLKKVAPTQAAIIGLFQCAALIPGVSRSAATIWGGLAVKMDRQAATEFSFLLAVPTLTAATLYKGYKGFSGFSSEEWKLLLWGNLLSFVVGWIAIRGFIHYITRHGLKVFGYYRILVGGATLIACGLGLL
jgi:undecaprenyl-diphosphatase